MSGRRLFVPRERIAGDRAELSASDLHYLRDVLRLGPGGAVEVFDGEGGWHEGRLSSDGAALLLGERREAPPPGARIHLAFALARGERCDLVVQKATELGVSRLQPFAAVRSVLRLEGARADERVLRWGRIASEAARQSGRADVPPVERPVPLQRVLEDAPPGTRMVLFHEGGGEPLRDVIDPSAPAHLAVIGPEGGLAPEEVAACLAAGARLATLGPRILRNETAAIAATALLQHLLGDMG